MSEFVGFPKMARWSREVIVSEKIDGTNAQVLITPEGKMLCGSRTRWITPEDDNFGFAAWCRDHKEQLLMLGPGRHFGEWWGSGIQRAYGCKKGERFLSLFNVGRWCLHGEEPKPIISADPRIVKVQDVLPPCVGLVPVLWRGNMDDLNIAEIMYELWYLGSKAVPSFMNPEGIVIWHVAGNVGFKKTFDKDNQPKGGTR
jgi:hypothetical protein